MNEWIKTCQKLSFIQNIFILDPFPTNIFHLYQVHILFGCVQVLFKISYKSLQKCFYDFPVYCLGRVDTGQWTVVDKSPRFGEADTNIVLYVTCPKALQDTCHNIRQQGLSDEKPTTQGPRPLENVWHCFDHFNFSCTEGQKARATKTNKISPVFSWFTSDCGKLF